MTDSAKTDDPALEDPGLLYDLAIARLVPQRRRFVEEFLIDLNGTQAAIRAGYSKKGAHTEGSRLLRNAAVAEAVKWGMAVMSERSHLSQAWVREALKGNVRRAWDKGDVQAANRALQLLGQSIGMYSESLNLNVNQTTPAKVIFYFPDNGRGPKPKGEPDDDGN